MCDHLSKSPKFSQWNQYRWNLSVVSDKGATTFLDDGLSFPLFYPPVRDHLRHGLSSLALCTTLLRVRLLTKTVTKRECDVLLVTIWKYTYRNLETAETKCTGVSRGGPPLSQPPPPPPHYLKVWFRYWNVHVFEPPVWKETPCGSDLAIKRPPSVMTTKSLDYRLREVWLLLVFDRTEIETCT